MLSPRESGKFIATLSKHVKLNSTGIENAATLIVKAIEDGSLEKTTFHSTHKTFTGREAVDWCFVADLLNFSFWTASNEEKFEVTYNGKVETGYYGCCALINKAIDNGIPLTDCSFYGKLTKAEFDCIFTADNGRVITLAEERLKCLLDSAEVLKQKFDGTFFTCVQLANGSAQKLLQIIFDNFDSFRDVAMYEHQQVSFMKRAQILIADIHSCLQGLAPAEFTDVDSLTMFADYRVPQVLYHLNALEYSSELLSLLKSETLLKCGDTMEVEIRGCSIECVERIVEQVRRRLADRGVTDKNVNSATVDYFLWCYRRQHSEELEKIPYHRVRSIYY